MRKLLTATTALALVGGAAMAEMAHINISGDAELGVDYTSEPGAAKSKFSFEHEVGIDFSGSGTTDGGLSFGGKAGFDTGDTETNKGTVFISGAFGTVTFGDNDSADLVAGGIASIGVNDIGVDNVVEDLRGSTANQFRYDNSFGQISIAFSAGTKDGVEAKAATVKTPATDAVRSTLWTVTSVSGEGDDQVTTIRNFVNEPTPLQYNAVFGGMVVTIAADGSSITVDPDGEGDAGVSGNILGFTRQDEETILDGDGTEVTTAADIAGFEAYEAAYNLQEGGAVGGEDAAADTRTGETNNSKRAMPAVFNDDAVMGVSADTQYAFGMSFNASGVTVGLGYDSDQTVSLGMGFSAGDIGTNLLYVKQDDGDTGLGADVSYTMDASTLTLAYASSEGNDAMGLNLAHDLGGGASLVAGFGQVMDVNRANMGLKFSF